MQTDPYLWLEEVDSDAALTWVKAQNAISTMQLEAEPIFEPLQAKVKTMLDSSEKIPFAVVKNGLLYNFWRDEFHVRGLWQRTTLESFKSEYPVWEVLLDLDHLAAIEGKNWVWHEASFHVPSYSRALIFLSDGGTDAHTMREFDMETLTFLDDGFHLEQAKSRATWIDLDTLWVSTDFGAGSLNNSGYPRLIKEWKRGTSLETAKLVFEGELDQVWAFVIRQDESPYQTFIQQGLTFFTNHLMLYSSNGLVKLEKPLSAEATPFGDWLLLELKEDWETNGVFYPQGALLISNLEAAFDQKAVWTVLFTPTERSALADFALTKNKIVLNILENVQNRIDVLHFENDSWRCVPLPVPSNTAIYVWAYNRLLNNDLWLSVTGFLTPTTLCLQTDGSSLETIKSSPDYFETTGLQVQQIEAISKDGTRIPYFQISSKNMVLNGQNPTLLNGYGGFEVSKLPSYTGATGMGWLELGGVFVVANIRGGGEFGPRWHRAALRENRQVAYEDFLAVAKDLQSRQVTSPQHLGIMGGSNGGLLMGTMLTQRPDLFGAVVCAVPLLDMQRYHKLLAGASWIAEYGDPDNPDDWEFIGQYSPYQNVKADQTYPTVFFTTSTRDDRVHPGHARKMMARMLEQKHSVLYFENTEGGHAGAANNAQIARMRALEFAFLWRELEWFFEQPNISLFFLSLA